MSSIVSDFGALNLSGSSSPGDFCDSGIVGQATWLLRTHEGASDLTALAFRDVAELDRQLHGARRSKKKSARKVARLMGAWVPPMIPFSKLEIMQALLVEFRICAPLDSPNSKKKGKWALPVSVKQAKQLIRMHLHISVAQFLECKRQGMTAYKQVRQYGSKSALTQALKDKPDLLTSKELVKEALLQCLLVDLPL